MAIGANALGVGVRKCSEGRVLVEGGEHRPAGVDPLVDLADPLVEQLGQDNVAVEQLRAVLIADPQGIAKAARNGEQHPVALALEQGVGRDRRAHLHRVHITGRDRCLRRQPEDVADALDRRVGVAFGILRQQLRRHHPPVRPARDHVGKGSAAIDPEFPARVAIALHPPNTA